MKTIGSILKQYRLDKGLNGKELSLKSGVARGYITEMELGRYINPSIEVVCKLCIALEITPNDLIPKEMYKKEN